MTSSLLNLARVAVTVPIFLFLARMMHDRLGDVGRGGWAILGAFWLQPALFDLGLGESITRSVASHRAHGRRAIAAVMTVGIGGLALVALGLAAAWLAGARTPLVDFVARALADSSPPAGELRVAADLAILALLAALPLWGIVRALQGLDRFGLAGSLQVSVVAIYAASAMAGLVNDATICAMARAAVIANGLGLLLGAATLLAVLARTSLADSAPFAATSPHAHGRIAAEIAGFAPFVYASALVGICESIAGKFFLAAAPAAGAAAAGYLDNALDVATRLRTLPLLLLAPLVPAVAAATSSSERRIHLEDCLRRTALVAVPLLVGAMMFAHPFTRLWLGDEPAERTRAHETAVALVILAAGMLAQLAYAPGAFHLLGSGRPRAVMVVSLLSAAVALTAAWWLAPRLGARGVALGITAGHVTAALVFLPWFCRRVEPGLSLGSVGLPPLACMVAAAGLARMATDHPSPPTWIGFLTACTAAVALYAVFLALIGMSRTPPVPDSGS